MVLLSFVSTQKVCWVCTFQSIFHILSTQHLQFSSTATSQSTWVFENHSSLSVAYMHACSLCIVCMYIFFGHFRFGGGGGIKVGSWGMCVRMRNFFFTSWIYSIILEWISIDCIDSSFSTACFQLAHTF